MLFRSEKQGFFIVTLYATSVPLDNHFLEMKWSFVIGHGHPKEIHDGNGVTMEKKGGGLSISRK